MEKEHEIAGHAAQAVHALGAAAGEHALHAAEHASEIVRTQPMGFLWLIPLFPLLGFLLNAFLGSRLQARYGKRVNHSIAIGAMVLSSLTAEVAFFKLLQQPEQQRFFRDVLWTMWNSGALKVDLAFGVDPLGMMMTLLVTHVATLIHIYSTGYMHEEPAYWRFFMWLNLFVFSMLLLVMGSNFVVMFFGCEGVGLCSYGLIGFWYEDIDKAAAGMKAFVVNRFGDFGFIIGLFILFWSLSGVWSNDKYVPEPGLSSTIKGNDAVVQRVSPEGVRLGPTLEFVELRDQVVDGSSGVAHRLQGMTLWGFPVIALICIFMFVGATGKSAQIPLFVWLPDAMAGPTPVSALIHAATMVTAGVYMVARLNFLFALSPAAMTVVAVTGAATALFAASIGFFQYDIKKVLAYSTVSQLGFMFIGVGVGAYWAGVYHLLTHAFFKACLFLGSGSVIMACHHEQDMRKMGGLKQFTPITRWTYLIACITIAGFPVASGFYSKDEILWKAWTAEGLVAPWIGPAIYLVGAVAALGTSFYMFRSYFMTFTGTYRGGEGHGHDAPAADAGHGAAAHDAGHGAHDAGHAHDAAKTATDAHGADAHGKPADAHGAAAGHGDAHGHGGTPHESPASMTYVLAILAFASVAAIALGWPKAWGGAEPLLEKFLGPSLPAAESIRFAEPGHSTEYLFQLIGVLIASAGAFAAWVLYDENKSPIPAALKQKFFGAWTVVYNKYYVDELYQATVIRGSLALSKIYYWIDQNIIDAIVVGMASIGKMVAYVDDSIDRVLVDGAVNGVGAFLLGAGGRLRKLQTGHVQNYLFGALAGAIAFVVLQYVIR